MNRLEGKIAFVTGGSRGMGAAIATKLAQEGAHVAFTHSGRHTSKAQQIVTQIEAHGQKGLGIVANHENPTSVVDALEKAQQALGAIDMLVNNAGVYMQKPIEAYTEQEFDQMMNVNVKTVFMASQWAAKHMNDGGRIITIGSNMADRVTFPEGSLYAMSKSALIGLTKGMARDLGGRNITVNLVQPGPIDTDMNPANSAHAPFLVNALAIKRYGTVEEIASIVAYLSSSESQFVTGTALTIDGGFNI